MQLHYRDETRSKKCPCCTIADETAAHVLLCPEADRVEIFHATAEFLEDWTKVNDTDPDLAECIGEYVRGCVTASMSEMWQGLGSRFDRLGEAQDIVGWCRVMEGLISREIAEIQHWHLCLSGSCLSIER